MVESRRDGVPSGVLAEAVDALQRVRFSPAGVLLRRELLSAEALGAILEGPLLQGFRTPLSHGEALRSLSQASAPPPDPLLRVINGARVD